MLRVTRTFGRSLDEFNAYLLQKKGDYDGGKARRLLEGLVGRHFETEPLSFHKLKHLDLVGLRAAFDRAEKIAWDANDPLEVSAVLNWRLETVNLTITIVTHLSPSGARVPSTVKSDFCSRKLVLCPVCGCVFAWRFSGAWRFNPFIYVWQTKNIAICICVLDTVLLRSTRRSWILSDSEGLDMVDG